MEDNQNESSNLLNPKDPESSNNNDTIQRVVLRWENLNFSLSSSSIQILKNVSGFSNPEQIFAIMGASGSGKTSLLSLLSNQLMMQSNFNIEGEIYANSSKFEEIDTSNLIKFVPQENILFEFLTPKEFLTFNLNMKSLSSKQEIKAKIKTILEQFKLTKVQHSIIGGNIVKGLSGGEKKRLVIAAEIVVLPSVLILDEPTSGLDSYLAKLIVESLKTVAGLGVAVIMTIHQPGIEIFQMIDRLALMQEGKFVYQGKADKALDYFRDLGFFIPEHINPPEFFIKVIRIENRFNLTEEEKRISKLLIEKYQDSIEFIWNDIDKEYSKSEIRIIKSKQPFLRSISWLFWREFLNFKRNPLMNTFKMTQIFIFALICDLLYYKIGYGNKGVEERKGILISFLFIFNFIPAFTISMNLAYERKIVLKELKEGMYGINPYYLIKLVIELPMIFLAPFILTICTYYIVDLNQESTNKIFILILIGEVTYLNGFAIGLLAGSVSISPILANVYGASISTCFMLFAGYFHDPESGPSSTSWLRFVVPHYYLRNAILKNEFDDLNLDDEVVYMPEDRYNYDGEVADNTLITFVHFFVIYFLAVACYSIQIHYSRIKKNSFYGNNTK